MIFQSKNIRTQRNVVSGFARHTLPVVLIILISMTGIQAQQTSDQEVSASINVTGRIVAEVSMQSILIESMYNPSFQQANIDMTQVIVDPVTDQAGSVGGAGMLVTKGEPNRIFQVTIPQTVTLTNKDTGTTLNVRVKVSHNGIIDQSSSDYIRETVSAFQLNTDGEYYFWMGGEINVADVEEGEYEGNFLLEVEYV